MNLLEYEIVECWKEGGGAQGPPATKIKLGSKPDVSAWVRVPPALAHSPNSLAHSESGSRAQTKLGDLP